LAELKYEQVHWQSRAQLEKSLASGDSEQIRSALYSAAWHEENWRWTQENCLKFIRHDDPLVRWAAVLSLGYIAQFRKKLDLDKVLPALHDVRPDPAIRSIVDDALEMIALNIKLQ
jgi:hypothetical protein